MLSKSRRRVIRRRLIQFVPVLLLVTFFSFFLLHLGPGDPAILLAGETPTAESIAAIRQLYGLDQPIYVQYFQWLWHALHGDLGLSLSSREPVIKTIVSKFPYTLLIVVYSMVISILVGAALGIAAAARPNSWVDTLATGLITLAHALPYFWVCMLLVSYLALDLELFPATGAIEFSEDPIGALHAATLPAIALAISGAANITRQLRASMIEVLASPFVRTLRAKGLSSTRIMWKHGLKNVGMTLVTVIALVFNGKVGGTVLTETVFAIPGIGSALVLAAVNKDYFVVQGIILVMALIVVVVNLVADMLYALLDPRVE